MNLEQTIKEKLGDIKKLLFATELKFEDAKLIDGTLVRIEPEVAVGALVQVIGADGELLPAPDAAHQLEDGSVVTTEGGLIVEIVPAPEGDVVVEEMEVAPNAPTLAPPKPAFNMDEIQAAVMAKINASIGDRINNLKFASVAEVAALKAENENLKKAVNEMADLFEKFATTPTAEPTKPVKNYFKKEPTDGLDRWLALRKTTKTNS
jgi:hypothetical protein